MNEKKVSIIYSWPVIILAIFIFWPLAIILVIRRATIDRCFALVVGKILGIVGICSYVLVILGILACIINGYFLYEDIAIILFFAIAGIVFRKVAKAIKTNAESVRRYLAVIINGNVRQLDQIASATGKSYEVVKKDINKLIQKGYLRNAYIDESTREIVLPVVESPENAKLNNTGPVGTHDKPVAQVVTCPCCGANNTIFGNTGECEYCGSPLEGVTSADRNTSPPLVEENKGYFDVLLESVGNNKINVIKVIRDYTELDLHSAKSLVEGTPQVVKQNVSTEEAYALKSALEAVGARVILR